MTRPLTTESEALRDRFAKVLSDHAIVPEQEGFHGWRCGHPDRYPGYCHCVPDLLDDLMAAAEARALPSVEALPDDRCRYIIPNALHGRKQRCNVKRKNHDGERHQFARVLTTGASRDLRPLGECSGCGSDRRHPNPCCPDCDCIPVHVEDRSLPTVGMHRMDASDPQGPFPETCVHCGDGWGAHDWSGPARALPTVEALARALHATGLNTIGKRPGSHGVYTERCICNPDAAAILAAATPASAPEADRG